CPPPIWKNTPKPGRPASLSDGLTPLLFFISRKSTFFSVLTKSQAAAENFPFCTIDPNESRVPIPDERYDFLCQFRKPPSKMPAFLNVVDIACLVKGAEGPEKVFLSHISACAFEEEDVIHVEGTVDPVRDMEIIHEDLRLKDEEMIGPIIDKLEKTAIRGGDKKLKPEYDVICKIKSWVMDEKKHVRSVAIGTARRNTCFLTSKPTIYLEWVDSRDPRASVIPLGGSLQSQRQDKRIQTPRFELNFLSTSVLSKIILLQEYFFTAGPDEVRARTGRRGTEAPQAAGKIRADFAKALLLICFFCSFLCYRQQGNTDNRAETVVEDGGIIFFKFNTPNAPKKK
uniref:Obg like ATPase 1 n=1 Tax=Gasterosteus aculeatus aculeatus TaxID=481459 RepID=G3NLS3_GASAC